MSPKSDPASIVFRARRAAPRDPRNSRKKASAAAGRGRRRSTARRSHQTTPNASGQRRKKAREREEEQVRREDREQVKTRERLSRRRRRHGEGERHDRGEQRRLGADVHAPRILDGFRAGCPALESLPRRRRAGGPLRGPRAPTALGRHPAAIRTLLPPRYRSPRRLALHRSSPRRHRRWTSRRFFRTGPPPRQAAFDARALAEAARSLSRARPGRGRFLRALALAAPDAGARRSARSRGSRRACPTSPTGSRSSAAARSTRRAGGEAARRVGRGAGRLARRGGGAARAARLAGRSATDARRSARSRRSSPAPPRRARRTAARRRSSSRAGSRRRATPPTRARRAFRCLLGGSPARAEAGECLAALPRSCPPHGGEPAAEEVRRAEALLDAEPQRGRGGAPRKAVPDAGGGGAGRGSPAARAPRSARAPEMRSYADAVEALRPVVEGATIPRSASARCSCSRARPRSPATRTGGRPVPPARARLPGARVADDALSSPRTSSPRRERRRGARGARRRSSGTAARRLPRRGAVPARVARAPRGAPTPPSRSSSPSRRRSGRRPVRARARRVLAGPRSSPAAARTAAPRRARSGRSSSRATPSTTTGCSRAGAALGGADAPAPCRGGGASSREARRVSPSSGVGRPLADDPQFRAGVLLLRLGLAREAAAELAAMDARPARREADAPDAAVLLVADLLDRAGDHRSAPTTSSARGRARSGRPPAGEPARVAHRVPAGVPRRGEALGAPGGRPGGPRAGPHARGERARSARRLAGGRHRPHAAHAPDRAARSPGSSARAACRGRPHGRVAQHPASARATSGARARFDGRSRSRSPRTTPGGGAVNRWRQARRRLELDEFVEEIPFEETRGYVKRVPRSYAAYRLLYGDGAPGDGLFRRGRVDVPRPPGWPSGRAGVRPDVRGGGGAALGPAPDARHRRPRPQPGSTSRST